MAKAKWNVFGGTHSTAATAAAIPTATTIPATTKPSPAVPSADAKKFGLENFGNTCYANSVIQALYFCTPFRDLVLQSSDHSSPTPAAAHPTRKLEPKTPTSHDAPPAPPLFTIPSSPPTLFSALRSLFLYISSHPAEKGTVAPRAFIDKLREVTDLFRSTMHQDAHEFLNYLLNKIVEEVEEERKHFQNATPPEDMSNSITTLPSQPPTIITATTSSNSGTSPQDATLVHRLFEGVLTSETRCLTCETVSSRDESFLDLSIDIEQNSSVTACLRQFSASEMLCQRNKFFCDSCCDLQEAEKRMKIKKLPNVLALHLKRFKYQEDVQRYIKLAYRVAFPFELRLFNTVDDMDNADRLYNLFGIVVHIGNGPHHGHYVSIIKTLGAWLVFDDDNVYPISENDIPKYFGDSNSGSAYVLYYQAADIDLAGLGLHILPTQPAFSAAVAHVDPSIPESPAPAMPPGLVHHEEGDISDLSDPPFPMTPSPAMPAPLHMSPKREKATNFQPEGMATSAAGSDLGELSSINTQVVGLGISGSETGNSSPVIPPKIGKTPRLFAGMRRTPSLNARTSVEAAAGAVGVDSRKSLAERTPRSIASSPALSSGHADGAEDNQPPPVPRCHIYMEIGTARKRSWRKVIRRRARVKTR
ncbi:hypothetical protein BD779DRAFT_72123 [Infundibulicybe gibba]|nr:hypothetical protein BD779DRAFT_72123 [Infundibulicybe gibba]